MKNKYLPLPVLILFLSACASPPAVKKGFNLNSYERIGVMEFVPYNGCSESGTAVSDEFIRKLIKTGKDVVEINRPSEIESRPQSYQSLAGGYDISGILTGTVVRYRPDGQETVYFKNEEGKIESEVFVKEAEVGVSVKFIDGRTGEVVWSDTYSYSGFDIERTVSVIAEVILDRLEAGAGER